ncbi:MAG: hypothetical protein FH751_10930 [Firmicutes bacterium]|nr:hypothetical protein [Bacillota bacterium]
MLVAKKEIKTYRDYDSDKVNRKPKRKTKKPKYKLKIFFCATIGLGICIGILLRYAYITEIKYSLLESENQIVELKEKKQKLSLRLEEVKESKNIEKRAMNELGMVYPDDDQIVYVNVTKINNEDIYTSNNKNFFLKFFRNTFAKIINIFDVF